MLTWCCSSIYFPPFFDIWNQSQTDRWISNKFLRKYWMFQTSGRCCSFIWEGTIFLDILISKKWKQYPDSLKTPSLCPGRYCWQNVFNYMSSYAKNADSYNFVKESLNWKKKKSPFSIINPLIEHTCIVWYFHLGWAKWPLN